MGFEPGVKVGNSIPNGATKFQIDRPAPLLPHRAEGVRA